MNTTNNNDKTTSKKSTTNKMNQQTEGKRETANREYDTTRATNTETGESYKALINCVYFTQEQMNIVNAIVAYFAAFVAGESFTHRFTSHVHVISDKHVERFAKKTYTRGEIAHACKHLFDTCAKAFLTKNVALTSGEFRILSRARLAQSARVSAKSTTLDVVAVVEKVSKKRATSVTLDESKQLEAGEVSETALVTV